MTAPAEPDQGDVEQQWRQYELLKSFGLDSAQISQVTAAITTAITDLTWRLQEHSRETQDVKTGQILQTVGLGYIIQERNRIAALTTKEKQV
jgi:hypothetical protein